MLKYLQTKLHIWGFQKMCVGGSRKNKVGKILIVLKVSDGLRRVYNPLLNIKRE